MQLRTGFPLGEKANRAISPIKEQWAEGWRQVYQYDIEIIRVHWTDERILPILGRNRQWEFEKFKKADLSGAISIAIDYESLFPKSPATERANIMQLAQMGVIMPATDPEQQDAVLQAFGETKLKKSQDAAIQQAIREWDAFLNNGKPPIFKPVIQNAQLHLMQHLSDAMTQEYEALPPDQQSMWDAHILATQEAVIAASIPIVPEGGGAPPSKGGPPGHPGSQQGSQSGSASAHATNSAPIRKGEQAADGGQSPTAPPVSAAPPPA